MKLKVFSLTRYVEQALKLAEYSRDDDGVVIARVPAASGFFAQGDNFEDARDNLRDVIEGNVVLALQLRLKIPAIRGVEVEERSVPSAPKRHGKAHAAKAR